MRIILALIIGLLAGTALATDYNNAESLQAKVLDYKKLKRMQALTSPDIAHANCRVGLTQAFIASLPEAQRRMAENLPDLVVMPADSGWTQLLQTLNGVLNAKAAAAKAELEALGVTNVP